MTPERLAKVIPEMEPEMTPERAPEVALEMTPETPSGASYWTN